MVWYDLIFITTFINLDKVQILLDCLSYNKNVRLKVILVAQNDLTVNVERFQNAYNSLEVISLSTQLSLSKARNLGIDYVLSNKIEADFVMFPDDDSSFDSSFFLHFKNETKEKCGFVIDVYNENSRTKYIRHHLKPDMKLSVKHYYAVGSTNMIIPYELFVRTGHFDELMGVGAQYGAGEDADYYIRIIQSGGVFIYNSQLYNFHPKSEIKYKELSRQQLLARYKNYGIGVAYLFFKHKMHFDSFLLCLKALVASFIFLMKFNFRMSYIYLNAFIYRIIAVLQFMK